MPRTAAPTLQLLAWIGEQSRSYAETIEVWKTSCPRLSVWEDAVVDGLVRVERGSVRLTPAGSAVAAAGHEPR
jgi:hypothetical protein